MPTCPKCNTQWQWKEAVWQIFTVSNHLICPYCQNKLYLHKKFRRLSNVIFLAMICVILIGNYLFGPSFFSLILLLLSSGAYFAFYPYFITFHPK